MCQDVKIHNKWCQTVGELKKVTNLDTLPVDIVYGEYKMKDTDCLCPVDMHKLADILDMVLVDDYVSYYLEYKK